MSKRMTDTDKWKKPFVKALPVEYKLFWLYILDDCDHAGLWHVDIDVAELRLGTKLSLKKAEGYFEKNIVVLDNGTKWFVPGFVGFQYGEFNEANKMYRSIIPVLRKYNLIPLLSPINGVKVQVPVKEKEQVQDEGGTGETWNIMPLPEHVGDLPEIKAGACVELLKITKKVSLTIDQVYDLWPAFKIQYLTGKKYYANVDDVYSHFINWIKQQKFENESKPNHKKSAAEKFASRVEHANRYRETGTTGNSTG